MLVLQDGSGRGDRMVRAHLFGGPGTRVRSLRVQREAEVRLQAKNELLSQRLEWRLRQLHRTYLDVRRPAHGMTRGSKPTLLGLATARDPEHDMVHQW